MTFRPSLTSRPRRAAALATALALTGSLVLAGCGGGSGGDNGNGANGLPDSVPTTGGTKLAALWPLTGLPAPATTPKHGVIVVKIDNSRASDPQYGLGSADLITEEMVEGGYTRLAVAFYSKLPKKAGPVRSARASDIGIVTPTHASLIASGAAYITKQRLKGAGIKFYEEGAPGTYRDSSQHDYLHSVFVNLPTFAAKLKTKPVVPPSYLPWGNEGDFQGTSAATKIAVRFSPITTTTWQYNGKKYVNTDSYAPASDQFKPDSVLVLRVRIGDAGYKDPAGNFVPETFFYGTGSLLLFHGGKVVRGTWYKEKRSSQLVLKTAAGDLKVPAGHVWMELLPVDKSGGSVKFK